MPSPHPKRNFTLCEESQGIIKIVIPFLLGILNGKVPEASRYIYAFAVSYINPPKEH